MPSSVSSWSWSYPTPFGVVDDIVPFFIIIVLVADENEKKNGDDVVGDDTSPSSSGLLVLLLLLLMYPAKLNIGVHLDAADVVEEVVVDDDVRIVSGVPSVFLINTFVYRGVTVEAVVVVSSFEGDGGLTPAVEMTKTGFDFDFAAVVDESSSSSPAGGEEELITLLLLLLLLATPLLVMLSSNGNDNVNNDVFSFFFLEKLKGVARPLVTAAETASPENFMVSVLSISTSSWLLKTIFRRGLLQGVWQNMI